MDLLTYEVKLLAHKCDGDSVISSVLNVIFS